jgi:putative hemin transport protein
MMALTRNESAVIEKVGRYRNFDFSNGHVGNVLDEGIDLRVFLQHWKYAVALSLPKKNGVLKGIAFFNASGEATHKAYLRDESDVAAFDAVVEQFRAPEQQAITSVEPVQEKIYNAKEDADVEKFQSGWLGMQDTHDFFFLLHKYRLHRLDGLALAPAEHAIALDPSSLELVLAAAANEEVAIMVFVGSRGCIEIHTGPVKRVVSAKGWLNVLDPGFNLHVDESRIAQCWMVRKPTVDGIVTSLEAYDADGETICLLFGVRKPGRPEDLGWRNLVEQTTVPLMD